MHTRDYFTDAERAAPALSEAATGSRHRSDPAREKVRHEAVGSYDRALAVLIIAIADISCGPSSMSPLSR
jgi:hypothetical protein